ncbi:hypothetical protein X975_09728, partial [Stegodyphus mimosarum]
MSSDSEATPSPLPSPIFARCSPARGTVARKCREFYLKRLERTASMQKRWSICDVPRESLQELNSDHKKLPDHEIQTELVAEKISDTQANSDAARFSVTKDCDNKFDGYPLRKCRSSFDLAMDSLRKE